MERKFTLIVAAAACFLLFCTGLAQARFESGRMRAGAGLGLRGGDEGVTFSFSGSFGYFVLHGLELSISPLVQTGGGEPTVVLLEGGLRFLPLPDMDVAPYLAVGGGRLFVINQVDAWMVSAGGGLLYMFGPWYGVDISGGYRWFFWSTDDTSGLSAGTYYVDLGLMFVF